MDTSQLFDPDRRSKAPLVFIFCLIVLIGASLLASLTQKSFGKVLVSNVSYLNYNGIKIRAKLLKPIKAADSHPAPGVVYIHGYQNNREDAATELPKNMLMIFGKYDEFRKRMTATRDFAKEWMYACSELTGPFR